MTKDELSKVQAFLQKTCGQKKITLTARANNDDSAEAFIDGEFIGIVFGETEDDERSFQFQMAILDIDLEDVSV